VVVALSSLSLIRMEFRLIIIMPPLQVYQQRVRFMGTLRLGRR